jgi:nucleoid-associated protein YgaU
VTGLFPGDPQNGASSGEVEPGDDEPEIRVPSHPRNSARTSRPLYMVRPHDTLRSIARNTLGEARRAGEILELNRELIDDPAHLIAGQLLELPEDAVTPGAEIRSR